MAFDAATLARIQFAFTIAFHILWPAYTIGIASFIVALHLQWFRTGEEIWRAQIKFWTKIFALGFGMGVVTGVVLSFQIGTNWAGFSRITGNVLGPLISLEVLTAFFLEAGFIGIMLFGLERVGRRLHFLACSLVAIGTVISAFWILSANSWMQTPAGFEIRDGLFHATSWVDAVFNPSFPYRFAHMLTASYLTAAFVVAGVSGWYLARSEHVAFARRSFSMALWMAAALAPAQIFIGDLHGLNTLEHQPMKLAAMEGRWETAREAPLTLFAIPDQAAEKNHFELDLPYLGSLILTHKLDGEIKGLKEVAPGDRPNVALVFFAFRIMVAIGLALLGVAALGLWLRWRGRLFDARWFHWICVAATPLGFFAILAGWTVTEAGRQPWLVQGHLRTLDAVSPVAVEAVATSLILFLAVYNLLLVAFFWYGWKTVAAGPSFVSDADDAAAAGEGPLTRGLDHARAAGPAE